MKKVERKFKIIFYEYLKLEYELFLQMFFLYNDLSFNFNCTHLGTLQWSAQWRVHLKPTVLHSGYLICPLFI